MSDSLKGLFGGGDQAGGGDRRAARQADREARREARQQQRSMRDDPEARQRAHEFYNRYTTGNPAEGYDTREAYQMYKQAAHEATPQQMQKALQQTVQNMTPDQRAEFNQMLQQRQRGQGTVDIPRQDPGAGGLLDTIGSMFGGGQTAAAQTTHDVDDGGFLGHLFGHGAQPAPQAAPPQRQNEDQGSIFPGFLDNPLAKVIMGGVAAYAAKEIADQYTKK
ncbi:MAG TPA: hypothetical protein VFI22_18225 [Thermomicrobiales bacterium]|nr:hypothetical protein [Thermomicrobiales bacterium]